MNIKFKNCTFSVYYLSADLTFLARSTTAPSLTVTAVLWPPSCHYGATLSRGATVDLREAHSKQTRTGLKPGLELGHLQPYKQTFHTFHISGFNKIMH